MDIWSIALYRHGIESADDASRQLAVVVVSDDPKSASSSLCSYPDLLTRSAQLAYHLLFNIGLKKGDRMAVMMRNSMELLELHFAAAAAHLVLVNVNTSLAAPELRHILTDSESRVVFAEREFHTVIPDAMAESGDNSEIEHIIWSGSPPWSTHRMAPKLSSSRTNTMHHRYSDCFTMPRFDFPRFEIWRQCVASKLHHSPEDPYQMYYTSGTTGKPKGVVLSQALVLRHALGTIVEMKLNGQDVWLHAAPMFHLVDAFAIYAITLVGGRHIILPSFNARDTLLSIERERVTCSNVASTMAAWMSSNALADSLDLSCLRVMSCGGSPQPDSVVRKCIAVFGCEFFVSYGMTECCGKISMSILPDEWRQRRIDQIKGSCEVPLNSPPLPSPCELIDKICSSGRPFRLIGVKVVASRQLKEGQASEGPVTFVDVVPGSDQAGEVLISGPTCFEGYWRKGQKALDRSSFVTDEEGGSWFLTEDLALVSSGGYMKVVDRSKDMLLVGGENVYSSEVQSVISSCPRVKVASAAVFGQPNDLLGEVVVAAVCLSPDDAGTKNEVEAERLLIQWCGQNLASYKVPLHIYFLDQMPMTGSGKVGGREQRERSFHWLISLSIQC
jgi:acyl-CoA synthetase (AMP-forming)/AMP-acid ligase II